MLVFTSVFLFLFFIPLTTPVLDDDIHYDIKWQPAPIELENQLVFTTKRKEKYSCVLPAPQKIFSTSTDTVFLTDIEPLLEKYHSNKFCYYRFDPYWVYEFCPGKHIRQYHETKVAGKRTIIQEYYLGYYHADKQASFTDTDNRQVFKIQHKKVNDRDIPMFSVRYTDGTLCEINSNQPREIVVFFVCHDKANDDGIVHFQEISSCYYEMIVLSSWLCKLPAFSPAEPNRHSINCYPHENVRRKPRNLLKLENDQQISANNNGEGAQFTMINADGTTLTISYDYVNGADLNELANTVKFQLSNKVTTPPPTNIEKAISTVVRDRQFLDEFFSGRTCLTGGTGWWRYEICYGKHVIQFHDEPLQRISIILGTWNREQHIQWTSTTAKKRLLAHRKDRPYVSLYYTNGDRCEATKSPRTVEVKLRCSRKVDKSQLTSMYLVEPETCSYTLGIESPVFCDLIDYTDEYGIPDQDKLIKSFPQE